MHTPASADATIFAQVPVLPTEDCPLDHALGRILRTPLLADRDLPPMDRVTMDGYAFASASIATGKKSFQILGLQAAGMAPLPLSSPEGCVEVATGSGIPPGADCVVPYEETAREGQLVTLIGPAPTPGQNIHRQASDTARGTQLIPAGTRLSPREIAVAASCGVTSPRVSMLPRIAIVTTGDELVDVAHPSPAPHQLRRSNDSALRAALLSAGFTQTERFHLRDLRYELEQQLKRLISEFDVIILTGGVSKGRFDFVPIVLGELGVVKHVQGIAQRPGKPFWFGLTSRRTPVFALPGNPVSTFTCFHRYVLPALRAMSAASASATQMVRLAAPVRIAAPLVAMPAVRLTCDAEGQRLAHIVPTNTSGDFASLVATDGFVELPVGPMELPAGSAVRFWSWA